MYDLGKEKVTIICPGCNRKQSITLQQAANGATIKCVCGTNIKLEDKGGSLKKNIKGLNDAFKKLDN
jgi:transcription elongation factor Elf1